MAIAGLVFGVFRNAVLNSFGRSFAKIVFFLKAQAFKIFNFRFLFLFLLFFTLELNQKPAVCPFLLGVLLLEFNREFKQPFPIGHESKKTLKPLHKEILGIDDSI